MWPLSKSVQYNGKLEHLFVQLHLCALLSSPKDVDLAPLPLLASLLAGLGGGAGRRGRAPPLLAGGVGLALLAIGCTGRLIRQIPRSAGSEGWRMRERAGEWEDGTVAHTRRGSGRRRRAGRGGRMPWWRERERQRPGFPHSAHFPSCHYSLPGLNFLIWVGVHCTAGYRFTIHQAANAHKQF